MSNLDPSALWILRAVLGLGLWTFVMSTWMGLVRLPAMKAAGLTLQDAAHVADIKPKLASKAQRVADNYNHLFEAPTVFYAAALAIVAAGRADPVDAGLAWTFVGLRVLHSLVQATFNSVPVRLTFYLTSWFVLVALMARPLLTLA
ncbi:MAG TPA: MAPEG family protein [Phenylobacterium sp.]|nr:MAPEG family protein [Phenylobacterium sp.]